MCIRDSSVGALKHLITRLSFCLLCLKLGARFRYRFAISGASDLEIKVPVTTTLLNCQRTSPPFGGCSHRGCDRIVPELAVLSKSLLFVLCPLDNLVKIEAQQMPDFAVRNTALRLHHVKGVY